MNETCDKCGEEYLCNCPTVITPEDIDKAIDYIMNEEIKAKICRKCSKEYYLDSYGVHIGECDECWFSRFTKEEREKFYRSFF